MFLYYCVPNINSYKILVFLFSVFTYTHLYSRIFFFSSILYSAIQTGSHSRPRSHSFAKGIITTAAVASVFLVGCSSSLIVSHVSKEAVLVQLFIGVCSNCSQGFGFRPSRNWCLHSTMTQHMHVSWLVNFS
jgi:hypothetical protein